MCSQFSVKLSPHVPVVCWLLSKHCARESHSKSQLTEPEMSSSTRAGGRKACKGLCLQQLTSGWVAPPPKHGHMRLWEVAMEKHRAGPAGSLLEMAALVVELGLL